MATLDKIKLSGTTYDLIDSTALHSLDDNVTSGGTNAVKGSGIYNAITASTAAALQTVAEAGYQTSGDVQSAISGKADTSAITSLFGAAEYDSTTQRINFYHESTTGAVLTYIDASAFVKDGFLESVDIEDKTISGETVPCLVFKWNTDAGIQETDIPLADLFDPSNYYTKTETDNAISAATSGKVDTNTYTAYTAATDSALAGKQATLVSGTNIKTVGGETVLGSGNVATLHASVSGTTLIFTES